MKILRRAYNRIVTINNYNRQTSTIVRQLSTESFKGNTMQEQHSSSGEKRFDWRTRPYRPPLISSHYYHRDHTHHHRDQYHRGSHTPSSHHSRSPQHTWTLPPSKGSDEGRHYRSPLLPRPYSSCSYTERMPLHRGCSSHRRGTPCTDGHCKGDTPHTRDTPNKGHTPQRGGTPIRGNTPQRGGTSKRGHTPQRGDNSQRGGTPNRGHTPQRGDTPRRSDLPPRRPRVYVNDYLRDANKRKFPLISVVSYNVLAQDLLRKNMFLYRTNEPVYLEWEHRKTHLLREILDTHADIFCLQEVQEDHFSDWYYPQLKAKGYEGLFQKRTGQYSDGCAVFYKSHKLQVIEHKKIQFQKNTGTLIRDNVAILVKFSLSSHHYSSSFTSRTFCLATTHLLFNHKAGEIKLAQMGYLLAELHKMATTHGNSEAMLPSVLCGDFNCLPNSRMLEFLLNSKLDYSALDATQVTGYQTSSPQKRLIPVPLIPISFGVNQDCKYAKNEKSETNSKEGVASGTSSTPKGASTHMYSSAFPPCPRLTHPFKFSSSYPILTDHQHSQPTVTTYHCSACETVDYILFTPLPRPPGRQVAKDGFHLVSRSALPSQHILRQHGPQPNHVYSSDHLYLQVDLQLL